MGNFCSKNRLENASDDSMDVDHQPHNEKFGSAMHELRAERRNERSTPKQSFDLLDDGSPGSHLVCCYLLHYPRLFLGVQGRDALRIIRCKILSACFCPCCQYPRRRPDNMSSKAITPTPSSMMDIKVNIYSNLKYESRTEVVESTRGSFLLLFGFSRCPSEGAKR